MKHQTCLNQPAGRCWLQKGLVLLALQFCALLAAADPVLIRDVTLIDGTGGEPRDAIDILVEGEKISAVGSDIKAPENARIIDASGQYVIPGLMDLHAHFNFPVVFQITPEEKQAIRDHTPVAFLYNGVTTVLNVSSPADWIFSLRKRQREGDLLAPRIYALGHSFAPGGGWGSRHGGALKDAGDARERALDYVEADADGFKVIVEDGLGAASGRYNEMPDDMLEAIVSMSRQYDKPMYVHAIGLPEYRRAASIHPRAIVHGLEDPVSADDPLIKEMADNDTAMVPTLSLFRSFLAPDPAAGAGLDDPVLVGSVPDFLLDYMRRDEYMAGERERFSAVARLDAYEWARNKNPVLCENTRKMHDGGVIIGVGTDAGGTVGYNYQGYNTPWEVKILVECGLTPMEALLAATGHAARILGIEDERGTVEEGKYADLLILDADPLSDIENIRKIDRVVQEGRVFDREELAYGSELARNNSVGKTGE